MFLFCLQNLAYGQEIKSHYIDSLYDFFSKVNLNDTFKLKVHSDEMQKLVDSLLVIHEKSFKQKLFFFQKGKQYTDTNFLDYVEELVLTKLDVFDLPMPIIPSKELYELIHRSFLLREKLSSIPYNPKDTMSFFHANQIRTEIFQKLFSIQKLDTLEAFIQYIHYLEKELSIRDNLEYDHNGDLIFLLSAVL
jgi:hypothetical protein